MPHGEHEMGMMMICMIATTLFALIIVAAVVVQAIVQVKMLREIRQLRRERTITSGA